MAEIFGLYDYPDGEKLDPLEHSKNLFSTEADPITRSIFRTANGGITRQNISRSAPDGVTDPGPSGRYHVGAQHIQPRETHVTGQEHGIEPLDFVSDAFGDTVSGSTPKAGSLLIDQSKWYVPVPGCSVRVFLPKPCAAVMFSWSFHYSVGRPWGMKKIVLDDLQASHSEPDVVRADSPSMYHMAYYNGEPQSRTKRTFPITVHQRYMSGAIVEDLVTKFDHKSSYISEARNARQWDFHLMKTNVPAGWHELSARIYLEPHAHLRDEQVYSKTAREGLKENSKYVKTPSWLRNRLSFGIRNARAIGFSTGGAPIVQLIT